MEKCNKICQQQDLIKWEEMTCENIPSEKKESRE